MISSDSQHHSVGFQTHQDIFGFLCYEMVHTLTTSALALRSSSSSSSSDEPSSPSSPKKRRADSPELATCALFAPPPVARAPLEREEVKLAWAGLMRAKMEDYGQGLGAWRGDRGGLVGGKGRMPLL